MVDLGGFEMEEVKAKVLKKCSVCKEFIPEDNRVEKRRCKKCCAEISKKSYKRNKDKMIQRKREKRQRIREQSPPKIKKGKTLVRSTCSKCNALIPENDTRKYRTWCKECSAKSSSEWRMKNREDILEKSRKWYENNKEKRTKQINEYYIKNKEYLITASKKWSEANKDRIRKNSERHRIKRMGISEEEYMKMFLLQNGKCAICEIHQKDIPKNFSIDHCHETGEVRGLLCNNCNAGIGFLKDDVELVKSAVKYLENPTFKKIKEKGDESCQ